MSGFQTPNPSLFFSRADAEDPRLGEKAHPITTAHTVDELKTALPSTPSFVIAGYPDDEGVQLSGGRIGAKEGPDAIRKFLYRMTPSLASHVHPEIYDIGNLSIHKKPLEERHAMARQFAEFTLKQGHRWIALGGGHDYAFADTAAFCSTSPQPLVINFDAHLDVRPTSKGFSSGTPFYRLLSEFPEIDYLVIGIQSHCNSQNHLRWLKDQGGRVVLFDDIVSAKDLILPVLQAAGDWMELGRPTFLSVDMDAFESSSAPGCSQSWPVGLQPTPFMQLLKELLARLDVRGIGIYETSPALDFDNHTAKLAALILHKLIYHA